MPDPITLAVLVAGTAGFLARRSAGDIDSDGSDGNAGSNMNTQANIADGVFPLPTLGTRQAVISDGFSATATKDHREHLGCDLMYRRLASEPQVLPRGSKGFYVPENTPVLCALPGKIWSTVFTGLGHSVVVDHGNVIGLGPCCTFYQHMSSWSRTWRKGDIVTAGTELGIVGGSLSGYPLHHLHFEVWLPTRTHAVDPAPHLARWTRKVRL